MSPPVAEVQALNWTGLAVVALEVVAILGTLWLDVRRRRMPPRVYWHGRHGLADCVEHSASRVTLLEMPDGSTLEVRR